MIYDVIIIGGGPAGITAGIYSARKKLRTLLVTSDFIGQVGLTGPIENWPGEPLIKGADLTEKFEQHLRNQTIEIIEEKALAIKKEQDSFLVSTEDNEFKSQAVLLTTGRTPRQIDVPGEQDYIGRGVVYCATCDAPVYQDKKVIVVGGGNNGLASAIELTDYATQVTLVESADACRADEILQERARQKGVSIHTSQTVTEIIGDEFVSAVKLKDGTLMPVDGVFIEVGSLPSTEVAPADVARNDLGEIEINPRTCETNIVGFYAAGDATDVRDKQIVIATAEGAKAALSIYDYLRN